MEEVRLTQHICFKTSKEVKRDLLKEEQSGGKQAPGRPYFNIQNTDFSSPRAQTISMERKPFHSPNVMHGSHTTTGCSKNSFLLVPKQDLRERLTSTPNQEMCGTSPALSSEDGSDLTFSPVISSADKNWKLAHHKFSDNDPNLGKLRGILFPVGDAPDDGSNWSSFDIAHKRKRSSSSEGSSPTSSERNYFCEKARNGTDVSEQSKPVFPSYIRGNFCTEDINMTEARSVEDSGLGSMNSTKIETNQSANNSNFLSCGSFVSPYKRRADSDHEEVSVESPMKRLAFMSLGNLQLNGDNTITPRQTTILDRGPLFSEQPGHSFLCDRSLTNSEENVSLDSGIHAVTKSESMLTASVPVPAPIFANSIPFNWPPCPKNSPNEVPSSPLQNMTNSDFIFMKPSLDMRRTRRKASRKGSSSPSSDESLSSPAKSKGKLGNAIIGQRIGTRHLDFVTELAKLDLHHVLNQVFTYIRPKDILRCSSVSESWRKICRKNMYLRGQIKSLKKQYRDEEINRGSENFNAKKAQEDALMKSPAKISTESRRNLISGRSLFGNLQAKDKRSPVKVVILPTTPSGKNHFVPATDKFEHNQSVKRTLDFDERMMPCPNCRWTAKVYGDGITGQCYNADCRFRFCISCGLAFHRPKNCLPKPKSTGSSTSKSFRPGSKKSMGRLKKRLML